MTLIDAPPMLARPLTTADEPAWPILSRTAELIGGAPLEKIVSEESSRSEAWITTRLTMFVMANPIASVYPSSMGYQVFQQVLPGDPNRVRKPDVSVIRTERLRQILETDPGYLPIVPDLAVEVLSPNDVWSVLADKVREYQSAGFPLVWIADPTFRTVMVHPLGVEPFMFNRDQTITAETALPGFTCRVADLFPPRLA